MAGDEQTYFRQRAEAETRLAEQTSLPCAATVHRQLAEAYLQKLAVLESREKERA